ncbi:hypothetical protein [Sunxiuqinia rutila]
MIVINSQAAAKIQKLNKEKFLKQNKKKVEFPGLPFPRKQDKEV